MRIIPRLVFYSGMTNQVVKWCFRKHIEFAINCPSIKLRVGEGRDNCDDSYKIDTNYFNLSLAEKKN